MKLDNSNIDRFFDKVYFTDTCWNWIAGKRQGYGAFKISDGVYDSHRLSYEYFYNNIPDGLLVCHHCDNPACINPGHLFVGSYSDNRVDALNKNRWSVSKEGREKISKFISSSRLGEKNPSSKLTEAEVIQIRKKSKDNKLSSRQLAKEFNVSKTQINKIINGDFWKHLIDPFPLV